MITLKQKGHSIVLFQKKINAPCNWGISKVNSKASKEGKTLETEVFKSELKVIWF